MSIKAHTEEIVWINGAGFTPCTQEYLDAITARNAIIDPYVNSEGHLDLNDMSPSDFHDYNDAEDRVVRLQGEGHMGTPQWY